MSTKALTPGRIYRLSAVLLSLAVLVACGGGSGGGSTTATPTPGISLSPTSLNFTGALNVATAAQPVTVTNTGTATLNFTSITVSSGFSQTNNCGTGIGAGANCTISVTFTPTSTTQVTGSLTIADNVTGSPQAVTLTGTGASVTAAPGSLTFSNVPVNTISASQPVTLTNNSSAVLTITSIVASSPFVTPSNTCGASVAANGNCTINVTFNPTTNGQQTGSLTITDSAPGSPQTVGLTGTTAVVSNTLGVTVGFGPNGNTGNPESNYYNNIYTTVTVCEPGTSTCLPINNVLVDTASVGLRLLPSAVSGLNLPTVSVGGSVLNECLEFGSLDYTWGQVELATVQLGGETASGVPTADGGTAGSGIPIQVVSSTAAPSGAQCAADGGENENTVAIMGSNGILGLGTFNNDCYFDGANQCTASGTVASMYITCPTVSSCAYAAVPLQDQVWNPIAAFSSSDTAGMSLQLPAIPAAGTANNATTGTITFGIGSNNPIPGADKVYQLDEYGYFGSAVFNGVTYTSANSYGSFLDSGSNALYVSDATTLTQGLGATVSDCSYDSNNIGYYCPPSTVTVNLTLNGLNSATTNTSFSIANLLNLISSNPGNSTFNDLGSESGGTGASSDSWDLGLPYFFGKTIFFGIAGTTMNSVSCTNGCYAF